MLNPLRDDLIREVRDFDPFPHFESLGAPFLIWEVQHPVQGGSVRPRQRLGAAEHVLKERHPLSTVASTSIVLKVSFYSIWFSIIGGFL